MIIKEGSRIKLIERYDNNVIIDEIIANEDIEVSGGHAILIRVEDCNSHNLCRLCICFRFEIDSIKQVDEENYLIRGFFKDANKRLEFGKVDLSEGAEDEKTNTTTKSNCRTTCRRL